MTEKKKTIDIKANLVAGFSKGQIVKVEVSATGIPLDRAWRRRLADAKLDNCCEVVKPPAKKSKAKAEPSNTNTDTKTEE